MHVACYKRISIPELMWECPGSPLKQILLEIFRPINFAAQSLDLCYKLCVAVVNSERLLEAYEKSAITMCYVHMSVTCVIRFEKICSANHYYE
jgi:hypothetical protein